MALLKEIGFDCRELQAELVQAGFNPGAVDDKCGPNTITALKAFQKANGLVADGIPGPLTLGKLGLVLADRDEDPVDPPASHTAATKWPRQNGVEAFFGKPCGPRATAGVCNVPAGLRIDYGANAKRITSFRCHDLVEKAFEGIFADTIKHYGEARWRELNLDIFSGCYNCRAMRGGSRYSMHAWGIAIDLDAAHNSLKADRRTAAFAKAVYRPFWEIVESYGMLSLGRARDFDYMHFQAARL